MTYKCLNNINRFHFRDAYVEQCSYENGTFTLQLSGLIARYNNPSNDTLVDRYLAESSVRFLDASMDQLFLEGTKYYSADDILIESVPDTMLSASEYPAMIKKFQSATLFIVRETALDDGRYQVELAFDIEKDEDEIPDTYWLTLTYEKAITEWDQFLNRATVE